MLNISEQWESRISIGWCKGLQGNENCTNCHIAYTGPECEISLRDDFAFLVYFYFQQITLMSITIFILLWTIFGFITKVAAKLLNPTTIASFILYLNVLFCVSRIANYVDPYGFQEFVGVQYGAITIWIGLTSILTSCVVCIAAWLDTILGMNNINDEQNFLVAKLVTSIIGGIFFLVCTVVLLVSTFTNNIGYGSTILNVLFVINVIIVLIISFYVVPRVSVTFKKVKKPSGRLQRIVKLLKIIVVLCGVSILIGCGFIVLNTFSRTNDSAYHWLFFTIALVARLAETLACILLNLVVIETPMETIKVLLGKEYSHTNSKTSNPGTRESNTIV